MNKVYFFDLPVYRLSPADYASAWEKTISAERAKIITMHPEYEISDVMDQAIRFNRYQRYGEWQFNEVIAYIRLYFSGSQLMAEYHSAEKQRNPISRSKVFTERSRGITLKLSVGRTNADVLATVREYVETCKKLKRKWFVDDSTLMRLGPHINWQSIRLQC